VLQYVRESGEAFMSRQTQLLYFEPQWPVALAIVAIILLLKIFLERIRMLSI
jgi:hypothetical protein